MNRKYTNLGEETRTFINTVSSQWWNPSAVLVYGKMISYEEFLAIADRIEYRKYVDPVKISPVISEGIFILYEDDNYWIERYFNGNTEGWRLRYSPTSYLRRKASQKIPDAKEFLRLTDTAIKIRDARIIKND